MDTRLNDGGHGSTAVPHRASGRSGPLAGGRRWPVSVGVIMALGFAVRLGYSLVHDQDITVFSDPGWYHHGANLLADGRGFVDPFELLLRDRTTPGAYHPPGYVLALAVPSLFGFTSIFAHQVFSAMIGTATIGVVALAGRRLAGPRAGLIAAAVAAASPNFWFSDTLLMSETAMLLAVAVTILLLYRFWAAPSMGRAVALGVAFGVTVLCRSETILLAVLWGVPLLVFARQVPWRRRLALVGATGASALVVLAPWVVFNLVRFEEPVYLSVSDRTLLAGNCPDRYQGDLVGFWSVDCIQRLNCPDAVVRERAQGGMECLLGSTSGDESTMEAVYRQEGWENLRENLQKVPFVVFAREGRTWGFYRPSQQIQLDALLAGREIGWSRVGLAMYYAMVTGSLVGLAELRRRRVPVFVLLAPMATVVITVAVTFGETRYRSLAEVPLALAGAVGIDAVIRRLTAGRSPGPEPPATRTDEPEPVRSST